MEYAYRIYKNVKSFYNIVNPATLSGAIDVIVTEQPDGSYLSTPFHVRFGKYGCFTSNEKYVDVTINGEEIDLKMKLGENGIAFFVEETESVDVPDYLVTSPLPTDETTIDTSKVLEESARTLEEEQRSGTLRKRTRSQSATPSSSLSSDDDGITENELVVPSSEKIEETSRSRAKKSLAFNASLFSNRRYRSLPNLSELSIETNCSPDVLLLENSITTTTTTPTTTANVDIMNATIDVASVGNKKHYKRRRHRKTASLAYSRSLIAAKGQSSPPLPTKTPKRETSGKTSSTDAKEQPNESDREDERNAADASKSSLPKDRTNGAVSSSTSSLASDGIGSNNGATTSSFTPSPQQQADRGVIADGALSDSEVDRHRNAPPPRGSDVVEWEWGELPRTRDDQQAEKAAAKPSTKQPENVKKEESSWTDWFGWSRRKQNDDQGIYLADLVENSLSDKSKIEKYLGKSSSACPSSPYDSGNASVTSGGLNSPPSASSDTEEATQKDSVVVADDKTPSSESAEQPVPVTSDKLPSEPSKTDDDKMPKTKETSTKRPHRGRPPAKEVNNGRERLKSGRSISSSSDIFVKLHDEPHMETNIQERNVSNGKRRRTNNRKGKMSDEEMEVILGGGAKSDDENEKQPSRTYVRSLRLTSDKLKKLPLERGLNEARFSITTKFQGTCWCSCNIYLYRWTDKIVVSDIDGTITKSDVLGHVIPAVGGQWAHAGVAELYTRIAQNGYKMLYLSSRAIGQSYYTKKYLQSIAQNSKVLPDGPLLLSPTSVLMAFRREVIDREPQKFKINALTDVQKCFPENNDPFYAGFGNRETDVISYSAVSIPKDRIYIINEEGRVRSAYSNAIETSYPKLAVDSVDYIFPPLDKENPFPQPRTYSDYTYWRPNLELSYGIDDAEMERYESKRSKNLQRRKSNTKETK